MKLVFYIIIITCLISCNNIKREIVYSYKDVNITRYDKDGETRFVYMGNQNQNHGTILVKYSGIVSGYSGYLQFMEDGKVFLLSGDGYYQSIDVDISMFEYKDIIATQRPKVGDNVCWVLNAINIEQERNVRDSTGVKIIYNEIK